MAKSNILVVEDEVIVARDIQHTLTRLGYEVAALVDSGARAVQDTARTLPDLVLMDIRLQGGMDGVTAADYIREHYAIPVIYLTAHSDDTTLRRAQGTEPYGYILKPFDDRELQIAIEIALDRHALEQQLKRAEQKFRSLLEAAPDAVVIVDSRGRITLVNSALEKMFGYPRSELLGQSVDLLVPERL